MTKSKTRNDEVRETRNDTGGKVMLQGARVVGLNFEAQQINIKNIFSAVCRAVVFETILVKAGTHEAI